MGIKDLYKVLQKHCPDAIQDNIPLHLFRGFRIAVDISIFLNKNVKTAGPVEWINNFIHLLVYFKQCGIKPICVFDGPNPPIEKKQEQDRRRQEAAKKRSKIAELIHIRDTLEAENKPTDTPPNPRVRARIEELLKNSKSVDAINYNDIYDVVTSLDIYIAKLERQNEPIVPEYAKISKEIINIMGFSFFQAPGEAETLCAELAVNGYVDGVISEDTDVLAYGTPLLLSKIDYKTLTVRAIFMQDILHNLDITLEQFRDMCILLSCDYNDRAKIPAKKKGSVKGLGPAVVYDIICEYGDIDGASDYIVDIENLKHHRCRQLFTPRENVPMIIPFSRPIKKELLQEFMAKNMVKIDMDYILDSYKPVKLKME